jgi:hypothetical protein
VIRGAESDLLLAETVTQMKAGRNNVTSLEIANTGHAPALMDDAQVAAVRNFLLQIN